MLIIQLTKSKFNCVLINVAPHVDRCAEFMPCERQYVTTLWRMI